MIEAGGLERDALTRSSQLVHVRPIRSADAPALVRFHSELSARSVYLRYFSYHPVLSTEEVERFTNVDYADRFAFVVEHEGVLVAVGRYDRVAGTDDAEVAFVVGDRFQHEGIGTLLADELVKVARAQGIRCFTAETLAENSGMLEVFYGLGFPVTSRFDGGVVCVRFPIDPLPTYLDGLAAREAKRRPRPPDP